MRGLVLALGGMVAACGAPIVTPWGAEQQRADELWAALQWGQLGRADALAEELEEPSLQERARLDVLAAREGRVSALGRARREQRDLALRYLASRDGAREALAAVGVRDPALWLEECRLSSTATRRASLRARITDGGAAEALALAVEAWQALGQWGRAEALLADAPPSRRLELARARQLAGTGRSLEALDRLLDDLAAGRAVPASLELLHALLAARPDREREARARDALRAAATAADADASALSRARGERARHTLEALLAQRAGDLAAELDAQSALALGNSDARARAARLSARRDASPRLRTLATDTLADELRLDADPERPDAPALRRLRLAHEWSRAARLQYARLGPLPGAPDWPSFGAALDASAAHLPGAPRLAGLPTRDYGWMGEALDVEAARARFPGWLLVGGKALGLPPMLAVYDLQSAAPRELPDVDGSYLECHVRALRVPSYLGWRGARFAGAGLDRYVFLDHDALRDADPRALLERAGAFEPWLATGFEERRRLDEPLDVAARVTAAALADAVAAAGEAAPTGASADHTGAAGTAPHARELPDAARVLWFARRLQALAEHERRHIVDTREFLASGVFGKLGSLLGAGLLPDAVRAELERRAQLEALRRADDPRIPLGEALAVLPLEGARRASEHARGYAALVGDLVTALDRGAVLEPADWQRLGLRRDRVLVQQLHLLPPETVRALAWAVD